MAADDFCMLRVRTLAGLVAVVTAAVSLALPSSATPARRQGTALELGVLAQLNKTRAQHRLVPLRLNGELTAAAAEHTREMGRHGYFAHESADGTVFWKRVQRYYPSRARFWSVGENLLWSSPDCDAQRALRLWMGSPEHRANILTAKWREIGISAVHFAAAPGTYQGNAVTVITTDFGVRR